MRVTTWNVNSLRARMDSVLRFAREADPDVLCLQETKSPDDRFPAEPLAELFPHQAFWGQRLYNGVAILSKHPLSSVRRGFADPAARDDEARLMVAEVQGLRVYALYVPNGAPLGSERYHYKLRWLGNLRAELEPLDRERPLVVVGDMNIAPDDLDVWDPFKCEGQLCCSAPERQALAELLDWGLVDAFREHQPFESAFTWWDYQKMGFQRNHGMRIDHIYVSRPLLPSVKKVTIHREVRGWPEPSDHAPVSVDLD